MNQTIINPGEYQRKLAEGHYGKPPTALSHAEIHGLKIALDIYRRDRLERMADMGTVADAFRKAGVL